MKLSLSKLMAEVTNHLFSLLDAINDCYTNTVFVMIDDQDSFKNIVPYIG